MGYKRSIEVDTNGGVGGFLGEQLLQNLVDEQGHLRPIL